MPEVDGRNGDELTPTKGLDLAASNFDDPDVIRDTFGALEALNSGRFRELLGVIGIYDRKLKDARLEAADNQAAVMTELSTIRGTQDTWVAKIEVLIDERGLPHERIEEVSVRVSKIENEIAERKRTIESIRAKAHASIDPGTSRWIAEKALELGSEFADEREAARSSVVTRELERARAQADMIVAAEVRRSSRDRRMELLQKVGVPLLAALIAFVATWLATHH